MFVAGRGEIAGLVTILQLCRFYRFDLSILEGQHQCGRVRDIEIEVNACWSNQQEFGHSKDLAPDLETRHPSAFDSARLSICQHTTDRRGISYRFVRLEVNHQRTCILWFPAGKNCKSLVISGGKSSLSLVCTSLLLSSDAEPLLHHIMHKNKATRIQDNGLDMSRLRRHQESERGPIRDGEKRERFAFGVGGGRRDGSSFSGYEEKLRREAVVEDVERVHAVLGLEAADVRMGGGGLRV